MTAPWWSRPGILPIPVRFEPPAGSVHAEHAAALRREWEQQDVEAREHADRQEEERRG